MAGPPHARHKRQALSWPLMNLCLCRVRSTCTGASLLQINCYYGWLGRTRLKRTAADPVSRVSRSSGVFRAQSSKAKVEDQTRRSLCTYRVYKYIICHLSGTVTLLYIFFPVLFATMQDDTVAMQFSRNPSPRPVRTDWPTPGLTHGVHPENSTAPLAYYYF
jgi:hypothetical protein